MAAATQQLNVRLQQQETVVTLLQAERESLTRQVQNVTATTTSTQGQRFGVQAGVVDTRVIGKPDQVVQAEVVLRGRESAVSAGGDDDRSIVDPETQRDAQQRRKCPQHTVVLHTRDDNGRISIGQVPQRRRERRVRSMEAVRDGVGAQASNKVRWTLDERAVVLVQRRHSEQAGSVREARTRLRESVIKYRRRRHQVGRDDAGDGGHASQRAPHPEQREDHELDTDAGRDCREHADTTVHRQPTCAHAARRESERQRQGCQVKGKGKGKDRKTVSLKKAQSDDQRKCSHCHKTGHVKAECRKTLKDLAKADRDATPERHNNGRAAAVLTARREPHVDVHHSHALREQRPNMRIFL